MTNKPDGGHAFPTQNHQYDGQGNVLQYQEIGMTLRDYFAIRLMPYYIAQNHLTVEYAAHWAYEAAEAMLKEKVKRDDK